MDTVKGLPAADANLPLFPFNIHHGIDLIALSNAVIVASISLNAFQMLFFALSTACKSDSVYMNG